MMTEQEFTPKNFKAYAQALMQAGTEEQLAFELTVEHFAVNWSDKEALDLAEKWFLDITKK